MSDKATPSVALLVALVIVAVILAASVAVLAWHDALRSAAAPEPTVTVTSSAAAQQPTNGNDIRLIEPVGATVAWRADAGDCSGDSPALQRTTDAGQTWSRVSFGSIDVRMIGSLQADPRDPDELAVFAGVGADCDPASLLTTNDGRSWNEANDAAQADGVIGRAVWLAGEPVAAACATPTQVVDAGVSGAEVCPGEFSWMADPTSSIVLDVPGIEAATADDATFLIARTSTATCVGTAIDELPTEGVTQQSTPNELGCVDRIASTPVAIGRSGADVWLWAGDRTEISTDGGRTW